MAQSNGSHIPTEWETLSDAEKARRVRESSDMQPEDVVEDQDGGNQSKEVVDPTTLDWRRVWDDYDIWDYYKPIGQTKLGLALEAHRTLTTGMPSNAAIAKAVEADRLVQVGPHGARYVPAEAHAEGRDESE